jgi:hypothetical protein
MSLYSFIGRYDGLLCGRRETSGEAGAEVTRRQFVELFHRVRKIRIVAAWTETWGEGEDEQSEVISIDAVLTRSVRPDSFFPPPTVAGDPFNSILCDALYTDGPTPGGSGDGYSDFVFLDAPLQVSFQPIAGATESIESVFLNRYCFVDLRLWPGNSGELQSVSFGGLNEGQSIALPGLRLPTPEESGRSFSGYSCSVTAVEWFPYATSTGQPAWDTSTGAPINGGPAA